MKYNLINVRNTTNSLDAKKADKASVAAQFAKVGTAQDVNTSLGSINSKVDTNSASNAKDITNVNGRVSSLSTSANTDYTKLSGVINNLDVTNDKINALRNLMHADGENLPKLMAMATSYTAEIQSNAADVASLASVKEDKSAFDNAIGSLQSSASNHADSVANSAVASNKEALNTIKASVANNNTQASAANNTVQSLATDNASLKDTVNQLVSALSADPTK